MSREKRIFMKNFPQIFNKLHIYATKQYIIFIFIPFFFSQDRVPAKKALKAACRYAIIHTKG